VEYHNKKKHFGKPRARAIGIFSGRLAQYGVPTVKAFILDTNKNPGAAKACAYRYRPSMKTCTTPLQTNPAQLKPIAKPVCRADCKAGCTSRRQSGHETCQSEPAATVAGKPTVKSATTSAQGGARRGQAGDC
jgi:hypothetical protein